ADEDGFQIRALLLTMFYRLLPTLIREGKVYIAESPLYEITCGKDIYFAYNEPEKGKVLDKLSEKKYTIQRSKGLGENEPDMMWQTTMNPESRRLLRVVPEDEDETYKMFHILLGNDADDIAARKRFISEKSRFYYNPADL
ncbi:MAG TPA: DNA topoisomerase, partial [Clostridiales bacterium]|nr:DNA topoisomerase [Clostridiales bacterium]